MIVTSLLRGLTELARRAQMEDGQALVEYALLLALLSLVSFGVVNDFGLGVSGLYSKVVAHFPN
jgi:Flp pilus assembly pilin Flp